MFDRSRCTICLITDRQLFGQTDDRRARADLVALIRDAVDAGVDLVQIRERNLDARAQVALTAQAVAIAEGSATRILVNDRLDVALAAGAQGTHLRGDSFDARSARRIVPNGHLLGRSVHSCEEAVQADGDGGLDYLIFGTVLPSASKEPGHVIGGLDQLAETVASVRLPVLAVGGITLDNVPTIAGTGAAGFAAIRAFVEGPRIRSSRGALADRVRAARSLFDSATPPP